jgi:hypothetical protein
MTNPNFELLPAQRKAVLQRILTITAAAMLPAVQERVLSARQDAWRCHTLKQVSMPLAESSFVLPPYT